MQRDSSFCFLTTVVPFGCYRCFFFIFPLFYLWLFFFFCFFQCSSPFLFLLSSFLSSCVLFRFPFRLYFFPIPLIPHIDSPVDNLPKLIPKHPKNPSNFRPPIIKRPPKIHKLIYDVSDVDKYKDTVDKSLYCGTVLVLVLYFRGNVGRSTVTG